MTSTIESVRIIEDCLGGSWTDRGCFARLPSGRGCSVHRLGGTAHPPGDTDRRGVNRVQARAPDQRAVDVLLGHDLADVLRFTDPP